MTEYTSDSLGRALAAAAEAFLTAMRGDGDEAFTSAPHSEDVTWAPAAAEPILFDPLTDPLPMRATPDREADQKSQDMCSLVYIASIGRFYAETGEGAGADEIRRFAQKAGYMNGRAVNGWNSRPGSIRSVEVVDGKRYINQTAAKWLAKLERALGVDINGDIRWVEVDDEGNVTVP
ncbi:hypothetical protein NicSoilB4_32400 [Arthrobacter sp. NicSoilB4]|uniref:hypothetical protein n=1 Tax=Arthrobacter sp. NicSoilB4 TaxID=2830997 RepID=UPI001CC63346|nr:hypothetical protein [Arthrobacter sp. NicSoilB4]BCW68477.1 hypothetical protein NicSoilB4_32400 [Arthrobacter sp. NicSoilB4]